jgi:hypothetical protein
MRLADAATIIALSSLAAFASPRAEAKPTAAGQYRILGTGADTCRQWGANHAGTASNARAAEDAWLLGYVTAVNRWSDGPDDITASPDTAALLGWMTLLCSKEPAETLGGAAATLVTGLATNGGLPPLSAH